MDGISIIIDKDQLELCRNINNHLNKITGLEIEEVFYDKMIVRDVNNYISVYSGTTKTKLKGCFEIYKELHKDQSSTIVPIALKAYFIDNIPIEQTIKNHKDIFDFCIRLKLKFRIKILEETNFYITIMEVCAFITDLHLDPRRH